MFVDYLIIKKKTIEESPTIALIHFQRIGEFVVHGDGQWVIKLEDGTLSFGDEA